jgi:hypothetical protein
MFDQTLQPAYMQLQNFNGAGSVEIRMGVSQARFASMSPGSAA